MFTAGVVSDVHPTYDVMLIDMNGITNREMDVAFGLLAVAFGSYAVYRFRRMWKDIQEWRATRERPRRSSSFRLCSY